MLDFLGNLLVGALLNALTGGRRSPQSTGVVCLVLLVLIVPTAGWFGLAFADPTFLTVAGVALAAAAALSIWLIVATSRAGRERDGDGSHRSTRRGRRSRRGDRGESS